MNQDLATRTLAALDPKIPRQPHDIACAVWPGRRFQSQQVAGAAARQVLRELAWQGLVRRDPQGWVRRDGPGNAWSSDQGLDTVAQEPCG